MTHLAAHARHHLPLRDARTADRPAWLPGPPAAPQSAERFRVSNDAPAGWVVIDIPDMKIVGRRDSRAYAQTVADRLNREHLATLVTGSVTGRSVTIDGQTVPVDIETARLCEYLTEAPHTYRDLNTIACRMVIADTPAQRIAQIEQRIAELAAALGPGYLLRSRDGTLLRLVA